MKPAGTSERGNQKFVLFFDETHYLRQQLQCYGDSVEGTSNHLTGLIC